jgi:hypothetical protein
MSDSVWYYARGEQEKGPITTVQIKALAGAGKLHRDDFVWKEGMENWVPAGEVSGLFAEKTATDTSSNSELPTNQDQPRPAALPSQSSSSSVDEPIRAISRVVFAIGLLMALLSRGCDTISDRNVARREALSESARKEFKNEWDRQRLENSREQKRLQASPSRSNADNKRLQDLSAAASKLETDRKRQEQALEVGKWLTNDQAAVKASADDRIWGYWRQATLLLATILLTLSLLGVAYSSDGPERWISFVLLAVIFYSLYASDSVWQRVFS